jgi:hypothetical protein
LGGRALKGPQRAHSRTGEPARPSQPGPHARFQFQFQFQKGQPRRPQSARRTLVVYMWCNAHIPRPHGHLCQARALGPACAASHRAHFAPELQAPQAHRVQRSARVRSEECQCATPCTAVPAAPLLSCHCDLCPPVRRRCVCVREPCDCTPCGTPREPAAGEAKIRADGSCGLACFHTYAYIVIDKCAPFSRKVSRSSGPSSTPYAPTEPKRLEAASLDERMRYKCGMATTSRWPALHTECRSVCVPRIA